MSEYKWIVYLTKNLINKMIYVGVRHNKKKDPYEFDGYYGTNTPLSLDRKKYGNENFERITLFVFETDMEAFAKEKEIVTLKFVNRKDTYNIQTGGTGGRHQSDAFKQKSSRNKLKYYKTPEGKRSIEKMRITRTGQTLSKEQCMNIRNSMLGKNAFSPEIVEEIKLSIENIPKILGWRTKLAKDRGVTKAAITQFIKKYCVEWSKAQIIKQRVQDIKNDPEIKGRIKRLALKWNISRRSVQRYIAEHTPEESKPQIIKRRLLIVQNEPKTEGWATKLAKELGISRDSVWWLDRKNKENKLAEMEKNIG